MLYWPNVSAPVLFAPRTPAQLAYDESAIWATCGMSLRPEFDVLTNGCVPDVGRAVEHVEARPADRGVRRPGCRRRA